MKDIMGMMKKVQEMQSKMAALQDELETIEVEGASGGGMVKVVMTAKGAVKGVTIDETLLKPEREGHSRGSAWWPPSTTRAPRPSARRRTRMSSHHRRAADPARHEAVLSQAGDRAAWPPSPDPRSSG